MPERPASAVVPLARAWIAERAAGGWAGGRAARAGAARTTGRTAGRTANAVVRVGAPVRSARAVPAAAAVRRAYASRPYYGEVAATDAALAPLLDDLRAPPRPTLVDRHRRSRRSARRSRRAVARPVRVRIDAARAADRRGARRRTRRRSSASRASLGREQSAKCRRRRAPRRHPADDSRRGRPAGAARICRAASLLPAAERRAGAAPRPSYFEAMGGDAESRLGAARRRARRSRQVHRPADRRALRPRRRSRASATNLAGRAAERDRALAGEPARASTRRAPGERRRGRRRTRPRGCARSATSSGSAPPKARYTEADDPKRLVDLDQAVHRRASRRSARGRAAEAVADLSRRHRAPARHGDRLSPSRVRRVAARQRGGAVDVLQRAIARGRHRAARSIAQLGGYLADTGRVAEAHSRCSSRWPRDRHADAEALNALGIAYARAGRRDEARRDVRARAGDRSRRAASRSRTSACSRWSAATSPRRAQRFERAVARRSALVARARRARRRSRCDGRTAAAAIDAWTRAVQLDPRELRRALQPRDDARATGQRDARARISNSSCAPRPRRTRRTNGKSAVSFRGAALSADRTPKAES